MVNKALAVIVILVILAGAYLYWQPALPQEDESGTQGETAEYGFKSVDMGLPEEYDTTETIGGGLEGLLED